MSIGLGTDFKIYDKQFYGGQYEFVSQNLGVFNAASGNALALVSEKLLGDYEVEAFLQYVSGVITRRDLTSVATVNDIAMTMEEFVNVKINRKIGPVAQTLDAWRKIGKDAQEMSFKLGKMVAEAKTQDYVNTLILAIEAALEGQAALTYDATGETDKTLQHLYLVRGMAKMGDAGERIACWVMHSKPWYDLVGQAIVDKIYEVANVAVYKGITPTLGRPTVVVDAPALTDANGSLADTYNILGLVPSAGVVKESEEENIVSDIVTGLENLVFRVQGEYAFNVGIKGFQWDRTNGGANPLDATLGTTTNWDLVATSIKHAAGVRIVTQ